MTQMKFGRFAVDGDVSQDTITVTGLGFKPSTIIFVGSGVELASGVWRSGVAATTMLVAHHEIDHTIIVNDLHGVRVSGADADSLTHQHFDGHWSNTIYADYQITSNPTAYQSVRDLTFNANGFTVVWTNNVAGNPVDGEVFYLAFGQNVRVASLPIFTGLNAQLFGPGSAISRPSEFGFIPAGVMMFGGYVAGRVAQIGVADASMNQWSIATGAESEATSPVYAYRSSKVGSILHDNSDFTASGKRYGGSAGDRRLRLLSMSPSGLEFVVDAGQWGRGVNRQSDFSRAVVFGSAPNDDDPSPLAFRVGSFAKSTAAAPVTQNVSVPGRADSGLFITQATTNEAQQSGARLGIGIAGPGGQATSIITQSAGSSAVKNAVIVDRAIAIADNDTATVSAKAAVTFNDGSLSAAWDVNNNQAYKVYYALIGDYTPLSGGDSVRLEGNPAPLRSTHPLFGNDSINVQGRPAYLGNSDIDTHPLTGTDGIELRGNPAKLRKSWRGLLASPDNPAVDSLEISGEYVYQPQNTPLAGYDSISIQGMPSLPTGPRTPLAGSDSIGIIETTSGILRIGAALRGSDSLMLREGDGALFGQIIPFPPQLSVPAISGAVNLFVNPSFEGPLRADHAQAISGGVIDVTSAEYLNGGKSLFVNFSGANSGVRLKTPSGLYRKGANDGYIVQAQMRGQATGGITITGRAHYTDGTTDSQFVATGVEINANDWGIVVGIPMVSNYAKTLDYVAFDITRPTNTGTTETIYIDQVQIEIDQGYGYTPWITGEYGDPLFRWYGGRNTSFSIRQAMALDVVAPGNYGWVEIIPHIYRADASNNILEDITQYFEDGTVTMDTDRDISWSFDGAMTLEGWKKLSPFEDWLAIHFTKVYSTGKVEKGQICHLVVLPSPDITYSEWDGTVKVDARSGEILLAMQGTAGIFQVRENTKLRFALKVLLDSIHLGKDGNGRFRYYVPPDPGQNDRAHRDMTWDKKEDGLTIGNDLSKKIGFFPIYFDRYGFLTTSVRKEKRLKKMTPARVWTANLSAQTTEASDTIYSTVRTSAQDILGNISVSRDLGKYDENKIVVTSINPKKNKVRVVHYINDPDNPISTRRRKKIREKRIDADVRNQADAQDLAESIAEHISSDIDEATVTVVPDPMFDVIRQVVYFNVCNGRKEPILVGRYKVKSCVWSFTAEEIGQTLTLGYVHNSDQLAGGHGIPGYIEGGIWDAGGA